LIIDVGIGIDNKNSSQGHQHQKKSTTMAKPNTENTTGWLLALELFPETPDATIGFRAIFSIITYLHRWVR
jgi:hypothetical protein